jgi:hypothetical protein
VLDAIFYAVCFYAKCAAWAARGTIEKANAWFWLLGIPIIAGLGWYFGFGVLKIPDNLQEFFTFMVVTIAASWAVFFVIRFVGAAPHFLKKLQDEIKLRDEREAKKFEFVFDQTDRRFVRTKKEKTSYFFGLHILAKETIDFPMYGLSTVNSHKSHLHADLCNRTRRGTCKSIKVGRSIRTILK